MPATGLTRRPDSSRRRYVADNRAPDEVNRWLRAVRPPTAADQNWTDSAAADELLAGVHRRLAGQTQRPTGRRRWLLTAGLLPGRSARQVPAADRPGPAIPSTGQRTTIRPAALLLNNYDSCPQLLADLRSHTAASVTPYGLPGSFSGYGLGGRDSMPATPGALDPGKAAAAGGIDGSATSITNVQEPGVDEPDIVKTDNGRLISITAGVLRVVDAASRRVTGSLDLTIYAGWQDAQLLVDGDHALVLLGSDSTAGVIRGIYSLPAPVATPLAGSRSSFLFVNLAGQPKVTGSLRTSGSPVDARLVGSVVRLVVRSTPRLSFPTGDGGAKGKAADQQLIRQAPLTAWLPQYTVTDGTTASTNTVPCNQVSRPAAFTGASMLTVYTLDLAQPSAADPQPISVAADGDTVYATADSLYIASNPNWYCCQTTVAQRTELHRFDISETGQPRYLGSGSVPGRLLNQYSLSDYAGSLRIATTGGVGSAANSSAVYVLHSDTLAMTRQVTGL